MALDLSNVYVKGCRTGISVSHGADVKLNGATLINCGKGIEERDPPSVLETLGLPRDTPPEVVVKALTILKGHSAAPPEQKIALLKRLIVPFLQNASSATSIAVNLIELSTSMYADQAMNFFRNLIPQK